MDVPPQQLNKDDGESEDDYAAWDRVFSSSQAARELGPNGHDVNLNNERIAKRGTSRSSSQFHFVYLIYSPFRYRR